MSSFWRLDGKSPHRSSLPRRLGTYSGVCVSRFVIIAPHSASEEQGDVRPIAIGKVFRRASARAICFHMRNHFARFFALIQHGVSTSNGSEILIHHIQLLLDRHPDWVVLKTDVRNAFNSISRRAIAERLSANFPSLMSHFRRMYGHSGSLVFATDSEHVILSSEEGDHQGDQLGPFLFAVGIHDLVSRVQAEHPEAVVLAFLDDVFIIGPESVSADAFDQLKSLFGAIHLVVADYKCEIFARRSASSDLQLPRRSDGTVILGSPIGNEAFVSEKCLLYASQGKELCDKITTLENPQCALLLLRHCHATSTISEGQSHQRRFTVPLHFMTTSQSPPSCRHCSSAIFWAINGFRHLFQFAWAVLVCPCFRRSWMQLSWRAGATHLKPSPTVFHLCRRWTTYPLSGRR